MFTLVLVMLPYHLKSLGTYLNVYRVLGMNVHFPGIHVLHQYLDILEILWQNYIEN